ncbi:hypothetical protein F4818DRAFT_52978 [Hypoxylon cercidicola]|nr:hypothetical protein F4818DRAFT_52978 [Hypoxylon cercidicola]
MVASGLYKLFPEFKDPGGQLQWTNRVKELRQLWSESRLPTQEEVGSSLQLAKTCFQGFNSLDMAALLLCLKNRELEGAEIVELPSSWAYQPREVQQRMGVIGEMGAQRGEGEDEGEQHQNEEILSRIFGVVN